jgi:pimeloyl-ACP methyl ester carboxylesterase
MRQTATREKGRSVMTTWASNDMPRDRLLEGLPVAERRIDVDGIVTSVLEGGQGPPMVLLHGGSPAGGIVWALGPIHQLARSYRLVVPDLPGLGESAPLARLDAESFGEWFAGLLRMTCREQPTLVAHSLPASLAARFAAHHGDLLRTLILLGTPALGRWRPPLGFQLAALRLGVRPSEGAIERFNRWAFVDPDRTRKQLGDRFDDLTAYTLSRARVPQVKRTMRQLVKAGTKQIPDAELRRIEVPTHLLWGRQDRMAPLRFAEAASTRLAWPLHAIDASGHIPPAEQPEAFLHALGEALRDRPTKEER